VHIRVLGAAAGGGFPQWNCGCSNCLRLRQGRFNGKARTQTQLAVSADDKTWFLLNASPDLRSQIESYPPLHPRAESFRDSPIAGAVLTSAEVDAALGLLLLRESQPFSIYATRAVRDILECDNSLFQVLQRQPDQVKWQCLVPGVRFPLNESGIDCLSMTSGESFPGFVSPTRRNSFEAAEAVIGIVLEHNGRRVAVVPGASHVTADWLACFETCDAIFFDGTFWSEDELIRLVISSKAARDMGHQPVPATLAALSSVPARKIFIHINNTNPMLDEDSEQFRTARAAGWEIAWDGMDVVV